MKNSIIQIQEKMSTRLAAVSATDVLQAILIKLDIVNEAVNALKAFILSYEFKNNNEEIEFFKSYMPQIYSELLYYRKLLELETTMPVSRTEKVTFYTAELQRVNDFRGRKQPWIIYYRTGAIYLDNQYFIRNNSFKDPQTSSQMLTSDPRICTPGSIIFSKIIYSEKLIKELELRIALIDNTTQAQQEILPKLPKQLKWKGPKVGLIEFGYACKEAGVFDEPLQEIFDCFEFFFSTQLGNTSRTFQEILSRKGDETIFLNKLINKLKERAAQINQNYKPKK